MAYTVSQGVDFQEGGHTHQHWKEELVRLTNSIKEAEGRCKMLQTENQQLEAMVHKYRTEYDIDTSYLKSQVQNERDRHIQWKDLYFKVHSELVSLKRQIGEKKESSQIEFMWMHPNHRAEIDCKECEEERQRTSSQSGRQLSGGDVSLARPSSASQIFLMESLKDAIVDTSAKQTLPKSDQMPTSSSSLQDPSRPSLIQFHKIHKPNVHKVESGIKSSFEHAQKPYDPYAIERSTNVSHGAPSSQFNPIPNFFKCYICGIYSDSEQHLRYHIEQHNEHKLSPATSSTITNTISEVENTNQETFMCSECKKEFKDEDYRRHLLVHMFKCKVCSQTFDNDVSFLTHINIHGEPIETPYVCFLCGKLFPHVAHLTHHILSHPDEKNYDCEECGKKYSTKTHLTRHMSVHSKFRPYPCLVCGKGFAYRTHLRRHEIVHSGARPHQCKVCQQSFSRKSSLSRHYFIHTTEKPFVCPVCQKGFNRKGRLRNHIKIHIRKGHTQLVDYVIERRPITKEFIENANNVDTAKISEELTGLYPGVIHPKMTIFPQTSPCSIKDETSKEGSGDSSSTDTENDAEGELSEEIVYYEPSKNCDAKSSVNELSTFSQELSFL